MDALLFLAIVAEQFAGRKKCDCSWSGPGNGPKQYMKLGLPGGGRYWCEKCTDLPPEAVYLDNALCCTLGCKKDAVFTNNGTRDDRICGECRNKLLEDEKNKYKDVVHPKCLTCEKTRPSHAIVPEGKTYKDVRPVLCEECVKKLPKDEQNKVRKRRVRETAANARRCSPVTRSSPKERRTKTCNRCCAKNALTLSQQTKKSSTKTSSTRGVSTKDARRPRIMPRTSWVSLRNIARSTH
ncbi:hypothetical protein PBCVNEJV1_476R [Paramecium bursaria Chlorella virus NE-JV-1]|nr:hypothetical protein PBCVNEJV1_476R [Paramecium bursaria Chlorella virus NE-JV-1]